LFDLRFTIVRFTIDSIYELRLIIHLKLERFTMNKMIELT
jgi:hypothetical protein